MKVQVQYVFYLDFLLPTLDLPTPLQIVQQCDGYVALLIGRTRSEPLFIWNIGENLANSEFTVRPIDSPVGGLTHRVQDVVVDRLIVAIEFEALRGPSGKPAEVAMWLDRAVASANNLLNHLRVVSGSHRVRNIRRDWRPGVGEASVEVPYTVTWRDLDNNTTIPIYNGCDSLVSLGGIELPHTRAIRWEDLCESLRPGTPPLLWLTLLIAAEESLSAMKQREAVLDIASACETRSGSYSLGQTRASQREIKRVGKGKSLKFAERFFHEIPLLVCGRSFMLEKNAAFAQIQACYNQRNCLMHGGNFDDDFRSVPEIQRLETIFDWLQAAREAVSWVDCLPMT